MNWLWNALPWKRVYRTGESDPIFGAKEWPWRYDSIDRAMTRPIHKDMSVAPPWAKTVWVRK